MNANEVFHLWNGPINISNKRIVLAFAERLLNVDRKQYRTQIANLIPAVQAAASLGFTLRVVAAGSMWATLALTAQQAIDLAQSDISLTLDK